jgi:hypothetical protein
VRFFTYIDFISCDLKFSVCACIQVIEQKGLDIVRRDWSLISKEIGSFCLEKILSGGYAIWLLHEASLSFYNSICLALSTLCVLDLQNS